MRIGSGFGEKGRRKPNEALLRVGPLLKKGKPDSYRLNWQNSGDKAREIAKKALPN